MPRGLAALLVVIGGIAIVALLLTFAGQQSSHGASDLSEQVVVGLEQIEELAAGPGRCTPATARSTTASSQPRTRSTTTSKQIVTRLTEVGTALGHIVAGFFIILFSTYFFLADGHRIWAWVVRLFPRAARAPAPTPRAGSPGPR